MSPAAETILALRDVCVDIDTASGVVRPLDAVSLEVQAGETYALVGESGCGKSMTALTTLRLLPHGGRIAGGEIWLGGEELTGLSEARMRGKRGGQVAMIFQEPGTSLNPVQTVGQQIGEALRLHTSLNRAGQQARALELLRAVGIPDPERRLTEYPFQLSGGMKQRVMIAMALAGEPKLLIADEPTTALDVTIQAQVLDLLAGLQASRRMALLLITHDLGVVGRMAQRIGVMYAGQLIEEAPRDAFFARPAHPYARKLFEALPEGRREAGVLATLPGSVPPLDKPFTGCRFAPRCEHAWPRCHREVPLWYATGPAQRVRCHLFDPAEAARAAPPSSAPAAPARVAVASDAPLLTVTRLKVHFPITHGLLKRTVGHVRAVDGLSLTLRAGRTLALVGESGCGKTTAGKAILRLIEPTAGSVMLGKQELTTLSGSALRSLRARMQMVFQDPFASLNPRLRVADIIGEGMNALGVVRDAAAQQARLHELMGQVGLRPDMADRYPHEFSGGQRQRIAIARALAVSPQLIICDEPTSALDVSVQAQILNLLQDLQARLGLAYLFITHNIGVVEYLAHEVAVMYLGRIVEHGPVARVLNAPAHPYTQALLAAVPRIDQAPNQAASVSGDMPSPANPPTGCHFHPRCPLADDVCRRSYPEPRTVVGGQVVRCHFAIGQ